MLKLRQKIQIRCLVFTFSEKLEELVISRRRFAENVKEMYKNEKCTCRACKAIVFAH